MNKFLFFFISCILIFLFSCSSKKKIDCARFKTGKFLLKSSQNNAQFIVTRDSAIQTELDMRSDTLTGEKIIWVGDCEYELVDYYKIPHYSDTTIKDLRAEVNMNIIKALRVRIVETGDDYYVFESWKEGIDFKYRDTLWKIK
jgi:hypothetical protein